MTLDRGFPDVPSSSTKTDTIQTREEQVLGAPPRIPARKTNKNIEAARESTAKLRGASSGSGEEVAVSDIPEMLLALMCHPELYQRVAGVSIQLLGQGALQARDRELVVLRTAWLCLAPYEWGEHVRMAKRAGVTGEEIEAVIIGSSADRWGAYDSALLKVVEELHSDAMICDETWEALAGRLDEAQLFELIVLVGQFTTVAWFQNALRFRLASDNEGLSAR